MVLDGVIDPVDTMTFSLSIFAAVVAQKVCHFLSDPGQSLPVCFCGNTQNISRNSAVHLEHRTQDKDAPTFHIKTLEHDVGAGHFQFFRQDGFFHVLRQVRHIVNFSIQNIIPVKLEAKREFCEHMPFVVFQVVDRNTEYPSGKRAVPFE